jgi:hypothetical protein
LALVMQSFGMFVVHEKAGEASVDLICIANDPGRITFLVEAKTSGKPYSLPKKDARAVADYIEDVQKALTTLPRLEFVLIVSREPSKTLGQKLKDLESRVGVPVRFCEVEELATLREMIMSALPVDVFKATVIGASPILPKGLLSTVVRKYQEAHTATETFVRQMMSAHRVEPSGDSGGDWPGQH